MYLSVYKIFVVFAMMVVGRMLMVAVGRCPGCRSVCQDAGCLRQAPAPCIINQPVQGSVYKTIPQPPLQA